MIKQAWLHNLYRVWYRLYYYLFALRIIKNPQPVSLSPHTYRCRAELSQNGERHKSFVYVTFPANKRIRVWTFFRLKFAFSFRECKFWQSLPCLTPWSFEPIYRPTGNEVKYGLNAEFVQKHRDELSELQFIAYD